MQWILFQYSVPNKPSKLRVYIWRKLKALRSEQLTEGLYALPLTEKTIEQLQWLSAEVEEMNGEAILWRAECLSAKQEEELIALFRRKAAEGYDRIRELLAQIPDDASYRVWLDSIIRQYADIRYHDYFDTARDHAIHTQLEQHYRNRGGH
ncbi:MAG: hypothetical protein FWE76_03955 [Symbiobacteriaceae bacterium]|nr:hypothetical protein [Symbiobacteriaceae bacterium]